jgi:hypothetical protein
MIYILAHWSSLQLSIYRKLQPFPYQKKKNYSKKCIGTFRLGTESLSDVFASIPSTENHVNVFFSSHNRYNV